MAETSIKAVTVAKQRFELRREQVERTMRGVLGEPIVSHYVTVGPRRYPPKQVIGLVTGLDRADFTSHQARRILMGLGFPVGRRRGALERDSENPTGAPLRSDGSEGDRGGELVETLRTLAGQWVAIKDDELLVAAPTPSDVVGWLAQHDRRADSMFRVPEDQLAAGGLAPQ